MAVLGQRHWYQYDSDDGKSYKIKLLDYLAEAAGLELNDALPELPRRYEPRFFWVQQIEPRPSARPIRKKLIVQRKDLPRFQQSPNVEVAGIKMITRSYSGENRRGGDFNNKVVSEVRVEFL
jgi:hypothetical protein